ncbi:MAG: hypothetical protein HS111_11330 [Kofleriaceae bacterium]|nr:hypothetical protein [Kofleriaceae bacterium]
MQRMFLLRPDAVTNNNLAYCLIEAARRFGIVVILPLAMSNHQHTVLLRPWGSIVAFMERFHGMCPPACGTRALGRWNLWAAEPPSLVRLEGRDDVLDRLVYVATNPVAAGPRRAVAPVAGRQRPAGAARRAGDGGAPARAPSARTARCPRVVSLEPSILPELGDAAAVKRELRERVRAAEAEDRLARERARRRRPGGLGVRAVLAQAFTDSPRTHEPRRVLRPRVAARNLWLRIEALRRNRVFLDAYRAARASGSPASTSSSPPAPTGSTASPASPSRPSSNPDVRPEALARAHRHAPSRRGRARLGERSARPPRGRSEQPPRLPRRNPGPELPGLPHPHRLRARASRSTSTTTPASGPRW